MRLACLSYLLCSVCVFHVVSLTSSYITAVVCRRATYKHGHTLSYNDHFLRLYKTYKVMYTFLVKILTQVLHLVI